MVVPQDQTLVRACQEGDTRSYRPLMDRHYRRVVALCYGMLGCVHEAEDAAQEAMLRGFQRLTSLRDRTHFGPWINRIARNVCMDLLRRRKRRSEHVAPAPSPPDRPEDDHEELREAIRRLPLGLRMPLVLYYFGGRNLREVAEHLGLSPASVCKRLREARQELQEQLTPHGERT